MLNVFIPLKLYLAQVIFGSKRLFIIAGNSDRESITFLIPMTIVRDEESHPLRGAAIKSGNLSWVTPV